MDVFVVVDTKGAGRLVGVFSARTRAMRLQKINPAYYRVQVCTVDAIRPEVMDWLQDDAQRAQMRELMGEGAPTKCGR